MTEETTQADGAGEVDESVGFDIYNPDKLPALLAALSQAQGMFKEIVRDKKVVQKLKDRDSGAYTGATIEFFYAELAQILDATREGLAAHGLSLIQPLNNGVIFTVLAHKDGCMLIGKQNLSIAKDIKAYGGEITYLRRYNAAPMLGVSSEDDADNGEGGGDDDGPLFPPQASQRRTVPEAREQPQRRSATADDEKPVSAGQLKNLKDKIDAAGLIPDVVLAMCTRLGVKNGITDKMTVAEWKLVRADIDKVV